MASTLLLDPDTWDLLLDADGNIAVASEPYALAQDAASQIKTWRGECYWDTQLGTPLLQDILAKNPAPAILKAAFVTAALQVEGVGAAQCFLTEVRDRVVGGQIQVVQEDTLTVAVANFQVVNPQGAG